MAAVELPENDYVDACVLYAKHGKEPTNLDVVLGLHGVCRALAGRLTNMGTAEPMTMDELEELQGLALAAQTQATIVRDRLDDVPMAVLEATCDALRKARQ